MNRKLSIVLSYLLHPVIYPVLGIFLILKALPYYSSPELTLLSIAFVFTGTYVFPVIISFLLYKMNLISSLEMKDAKDRRWPYLIGAISFYFTASAIQKIGLAQDAYLFILGSTIVIFIHFSTLSFSKPSAHLGGIGGFTGLLLALSFKYQIGFLPYIAICLLLAGFLGSARLSLKAHNSSEIAFGYFSGLLIVGLVVLLG